MKKQHGRILPILCTAFLLAQVTFWSFSHLSLAAPPAQPLKQTEVNIEDVVNRLSGWLNSAYAGSRFGSWIKLGDINRARERFNEGDVQVYIDPGFLDSIEANAAYVDYTALGLGYFNDLVLADAPDKVPAQTVWHEVMHAIFDAHDSELLVSNDEMYTWYMENVLNHALPWLEGYEKELARGEACDPKLLEEKWNKFVEKMKEAKNTGYGSIATDAQLQQLYQLTGFQVDVDTVRAGYVEAGLDKCPAAVPTLSIATSAALDLIFCIDVTGSMEDDIASVKAAAANIVDTIAAKNKDYRVALIAYRDWDDSMGYSMFEDYAFSTDKGAIIANINSLSVGGGDDTPEAVFEVLMRAIDSTAVGGWRNNVNKQVILMGDAPPHNPSREGFTAASVAKAAEEADPVVIQALVVGNSGVYDTDAVAAFRELAELTRGNFFEAADASKVAEVLQDTIEVIQPPKPPSWLSNTSILLIGACCLMLFIVLAVILFVVMFWGKKKRPSSRPAPPPPPATHWQGETMAMPAAVVAELVIQTGPDAGRHLPLRPNARLGRAADNEIVLKDPQASRYHAIITLAGSEYVITDLGSANGTWVNGVRLDQPRSLRHGDVIAIGSEQLTFQSR
jgi:Mg-chelatase subunit ChlD